MMQGTREPTTVITLSCRPESHMPSTPTWSGRDDLAHVQAASADKVAVDPRPGVTGCESGRSWGGRDATELHRSCEAKRVQGESDTETQHTCTMQVSIHLSLQDIPEGAGPANPVV